MDPSDESLESLTRNIEEYERRARRRVWISFIVPLFFGLLFLGYTVYRWLYHQAFHEASKHLDLTLGTINTIVLIGRMLPAR